MDFFELLHMGAVVEVNSKGRWVVHNNPVRLRPAGLLPGSFNPIHKGHWGLADAASKMLRKPIAFELSLANVDKDELSPEEVRKRLAPFRDKASVWLTRAATFLEKSAAFPGVPFVVGADTAERLLDPAYHGGSKETLLQALDQLQQRGSRFLVAGRRNAAEAFVRLADLPIPETYRQLFAEIDPQRFRVDICSTDLRS